MQNTYRLYGAFKWAKVIEPDKKFNRYVVDFYPDKGSLALIKKTGIQLQQREDADGVFYKIAAPVQKLVKGKLKEYDPPKITYEDASRKEGTLVGNGSEGSIDVAVFDTIKGKGHQLLSLHVVKLVEFAKTIDAHDLPEGDDGDGEVANHDTFDTGLKDTRGRIDPKSLPF